MQDDQTFSASLQATRHLDECKERQVNEAIRGLPMTRITIAHRPETIEMAGCVIDLGANASAAGRRGA
ncbi:hypothetical protein WKW80_19240 [Variovorax humicola]|uniref:ABC transporter ATP-binding protein n=1 Tax=Variovorax humicola TaxID=1769758 RepID=A0ABU8W255_9BURK